MILYPETQKRAQAELDRVMGFGRLPSMSDRGNLPYVEAIFMECLRLRPPIPTGMSFDIQQNTILIDI